MQLRVRGSWAAATVRALGQLCRVEHRLLWWLRIADMDRRWELMARTDLFSKFKHHSHNENMLIFRMYLRAVCSTLQVSQ